MLAPARQSQPRQARRANNLNQKHPPSVNNNERIRDRAWWLSEPCRHLWKQVNQKANVQSLTRCGCRWCRGWRRWERESPDGPTEKLDIQHQTSMVFLLLPMLKSYTWNEKWHTTTRSLENSCGVTEMIKGLDSTFDNKNNMTIDGFQTIDSERRGHVIAYDDNSK